MNVIKQPSAQELAADMADFIIDTDASIAFKVNFGEKTILSEDYVPDQNYQVRTHKLGKFLAQALWGIWPSGDVTVQKNMAGTFTFLVDDTPVGSSFVTFSRLALNKSFSEVGFFSRIHTKVTRPNMKEWATVQNSAGTVLAFYTNADGAKMSATLTEAAGETPVTVDVSPSVIKTLAGVEQDDYDIVCGDKTMHFLVDHNSYADVYQFRFKNVFDAPETVSCVGEVSRKGAEDSDKGYMFGIERKFNVSPSDEYTANSGVIFLQSDYKLWHDFSNAQEVQLLVDGQWLPVIISKLNYEQKFRKNGLSEVEFSFRLADPDQSALI